MFMVYFRSTELLELIITYGYVFVMSKDSCDTRVYKKGKKKGKLTSIIFFDIVQMN